MGDGAVGGVSFVLGRRLVTLARRAGVPTGEGNVELDAYFIAHAIGASDRPDSDTTTGRQATVQIFNRAVKTLGRYRLVSVHGATLFVKDRWPRLTSGLLSSLALPMQLAEPDWWNLSVPPAAEFVEVPR